MKELSLEKEFEIYKLMHKTTMLLAFIGMAQLHFHKKGRNGGNQYGII